MKITTSVAIQGEEGSYHDKAARHYFGEDYTPHYCDSFEVVFRSVVEHDTEYGLAAVENSLVGSIAPVYDLLRTTPEVHIIGEIYLAIHHSLIGLPEAQLADITTVYSHPVALDQCSSFFKRELPKATIQATSDTAGSAAYIKQLGDASAAAAASADNATRLGLQVLREGIEDDPSNYTRFLVLATSQQAVEPTRGAYKTSLLIERLNNQADDSAPGTLHAALACFADNGISLTKIESRPIHGRPWRYIFYLDCAAGTAEPSMQAALEGLTNLSATWRLLGTYECGKTIT